jgi:hypothetical protein
MANEQGEGELLAVQQPLEVPPEVAMAPGLPREPRTDDQLLQILQDRMRTDPVFAASMSTILHLAEKTRAPPRGREIQQRLVQGEALPIPLSTEEQFVAAMQLPAPEVDHEGAILRDYGMSPALRTQLYSMYLIQAEEADVYRRRLETLELMVKLNSTNKSVAGISSTEADWRFEPEVERELKAHPKEYTHLSAEAFKESLRGIPQVREQSIKTELKANTRDVVVRMSKLDQAKLESIIPGEEVMWAQQIRINAYAYDVVLKMARDDPESFKQDEILRKLKEATSFAFYAALGAQRKLFRQKLRIVTEAAGVPWEEEPDPIREQQHRGIMDKAEVDDLVNKRKASKAWAEALGQTPTSEMTSTKRARSESLFVRGRGRGAIHSPFPQQHHDRRREGVQGFVSADRGINHFRARGRGQQQHLRWQNPNPAPKPEWQPGNRPTAANAPWNRGSVRSRARGTGRRGA